MATQTSYSQTLSRLEVGNSTLSTFCGLHANHHTQCLRGPRNIVINVAAQGNKLVHETAILLLQGLEYVP